MDYEELTNKFAALAEADFEANGVYLNAPYRIHFKGTYYKGRVNSVPMVGPGGEKVGKSYSITIEIPVTQVAHKGLRDIQET